MATTDEFVVEGLCPRREVGERCMGFLWMPKHTLRREGELMPVNRKHVRRTDSQSKKSRSVQASVAGYGVRLNRNQGAWSFETAVNN